MPNTRIKKSSVCYYFFVFISIVSLITFFNCVNYKVEQNEYAVIGNSLTMQFHTDILSQGVYILAPGDYLIKFKRTLQGIELGDLECLTRDEVMLSIHVSTQFQYIKDQIIPVILKQFDDDDKYKDFLWASMRSSILGTCLEFTALEYYEERTNVDTKIYTDLIANINGKNMGSTIEFFQLVDIKYPQSYIDILHEKQNVKQDLITAENNRATALINANTALMEAERQAKVNIVNAQNYYDMTVYSAKAQESATTDLWNNRAITYSNVVSDLNLTPQLLIEYVKSDVARTSSSLYSNL